MKKRIFALLCALMMLVTPSTGSFHDKAEYLHVGHAHAENVTTPTDVETTGDPEETDEPTGDPVVTDTVEMDVITHTCVTGENYRSNGNGTHSVVCAECNEIMADTAAECNKTGYAIAKNNGDGTHTRASSVCKYEHPAEAHSYGEWIEYVDNTYHANTCLYCNVRSDTLLGMHYNDDGEYNRTETSHYAFCDGCGYQYIEADCTDSGNGTPSAKCAECGETMADTTAQCDKLGGYTYVGDVESWHEVYCSVCGGTTATEECVPDWNKFVADADGLSHRYYCFLCEALTEYGSDCNTKGTPISHEDGTHTLTCECGNPGETVACADQGDGTCVCGYVEQGEESEVTPSESTAPKGTPGPSDPVYPCECGAELQDLQWREIVVDSKTVHAWACPHGEFNGDPHEAQFNDYYSFGEAGHAYKCSHCDIYGVVMAHSGDTGYIGIGFNTDYHEYHLLVCSECQDHHNFDKLVSHTRGGEVKPAFDGHHAENCTVCGFPLDQYAENCVDQGDGTCGVCGYVFKSVAECPDCGENPEMENRKITIDGAEFHAWSCPHGVYYHMDSLHAPQYVGYASFGNEGHAMYCEECWLFGEVVAHSGEMHFVGNGAWHALTCQECEQRILGEAMEYHTSGDVIRPNYDGRHGIGCSICGYAFESELVSCTPGEEVRHFGDGTHAYICTECGAAVPDTVEDCVAGDKAWAQGDEFGPNGTHILLCAKCEEPMGDPVPCEFSFGSNRYGHGDLCSVCGAMVNSEGNHFDKFEPGAACMANTIPILFIRPTTAPRSVSAAAKRVTTVAAWNANSSAASWRPRRNNRLPWCRRLPY